LPTPSSCPHATRTAALASSPAPLPSTRSTGRRLARTDRPREGPPRTSLGRDDRRTRHQAPLNPHLPTPDERRGRTLHPDTAHRVGLRPELSLERCPHPKAQRLPSLVQQTPTAQLPRGTAAIRRVTPLWSR
jgi:hypothetical protein